jgi:hypothetical protein
MVFTFQDDFSVGSIHGTNASPANDTTATSAFKVVEIQEDNSNNISIPTIKTSSGIPSESAVGNWVASGSNPNPVSGPAANSTDAREDGTHPTTSDGLKDPLSTRSACRVVGGLTGK